MGLKGDDSRSAFLWRTLSSRLIPAPQHDDGAKNPGMDIDGMLHRQNFNLSVYYRATSTTTATRDDVEWLMSGADVSNAVSLCARTKPASVALAQDESTTLAVQ